MTEKVGHGPLGNRAGGEGLVVGELLDLPGGNAIDATVTHVADDVAALTDEHAGEGGAQADVLATAVVPDATVEAREHLAPDIGNLGEADCSLTCDGCGGKLGKVPLKPA